MATKSKFYKELDDGKLDLSLRSLREVPIKDLILLGKRLRVLDLSRNQISELPGKVTSFYNLRLKNLLLYNLTPRLSVGTQESHLVCVTF